VLLTIDMTRSMERIEVLLKLMLDGTQAVQDIRSPNHSRLLLNAEQIANAFQFLRLQPQTHRWHSINHLVTRRREQRAFDIHQYRYRSLIERRFCHA
jgi:hypothetical protein